MTKKPNTKQYDFENRMPEFAERETLPVLKILALLFWVCFGIRISIFEFISFS
jgi:hypothetical protein